MPSRRVFISYVHTPNYSDGRVSATEFGFGDVDVEIDFPINGRENLIRALMKGLQEKGVDGKKVNPLHWCFYE
jgi:hypothetical protein